ncbi:MAG: type II toxin-antitoxin system RelE/ParE family toxin [Hymenobacteraceae bacterium]|nr:type II toxin-antitoxin system RelE/ParE family toxin [Hymenobacteraceae bacterium]MDX5394880.1 type II toxin-antitoxin system RelE/ParE family toxin [Hymenobacteraceae bacterium]MDX5443021.1 type II toxin-antitoxin system RelE/ParE family toxin [Hymenobacteraceae bacterium]MDX5510914.1 type II toxin-antitoxin system RelE/ParE family toxin [Hymenobacteraceae bacterium]
MKNGYKVVWTNRALTDLDVILAYLAEKWSDKEVTDFVRKLDKRLQLISHRPLLYPSTPARKNVRRSVLTEQTTIYYRISKSAIEVLTLFDNRQSPSKVKV